MKTIPQPSHVQTTDGHFNLNLNTTICVPAGNPECLKLAGFLSEYLSTGSPLQITEITDAGNCIALQLIDSTAENDHESYSLVINPQAITVTASAAVGLFYGIQTLRQLLPGPTPGGASPDLEIPCVLINDCPRYSWRGMMLDVSRHFFPKAFIKKFIDHLAMYKLNRFHWHLGDDQGWRIEIKKYPKLTETGAWRVDREDRHWNTREPQKPGEPATYGGFYTQADIREIVAYAQSKYITIIPEIEMPGHSVAALAAYPEYSCERKPLTVLPGGYWPNCDIYCGGNDGTFEFLQNILSELIDLFPGKYLHIGGDEANKTIWEKCPKCQARIKQEGLQNEHELQSYFIKRMEKYLQSRGRRLIGWDEILEGGLAPEATVMSWRGMDGGIEAAQANHDVVMTPTSYCYFDYYQGAQDAEPLAIGGYLPLTQVYAFDPTPDNLQPEKSQYILGGQANLWTEYVPTPEHAEYLIFPRICALAEAVWSPKNLRDWNDFARRVFAHTKIWEKLGINFARSFLAVVPAVTIDLEKKEFNVTLTSETCLGTIHYTLDGSAPTEDSPRYSGPFTIQHSAILNARHFYQGELLGKMTEKPLLLHQALGKKVLLKNACSEPHTAGGDLGLTNSLRGTQKYDDGHWQGFEGVDFEAMLDLEKIIPLKKITTGFLSDPETRILLPAEIEYKISASGTDFETVAQFSNDMTSFRQEKEIRNISATLENRSARYIWITARNVGECPNWHTSSGDQAWLFVDAIIVE